MELIQGWRQVLWMLMTGLVLQVTADYHYIDPTVRLVSCLTGRILLKITNSQADGVMYIKDDNTAHNMQFTENGTMVYSCGFVECNLSWNSPFTFVIQQKVAIQTVHDVKLIFTCVWDQSDIIPGDDLNKNSDSDNTQFYIFSAVASMKFYNNDSEQIATGSYIKLGTDVTMEIKLIDTYDGLLDINVKSCDAAGIGIINDRCPLDEDLFDSFNKTSEGVVRNIFQMFRTTTYNPEPVSMLFSCLLEVCYAPCIKYNCNGTVAIPETSRRRRREARESGEVARSMTVGSLFKVGLEDPVFVGEGKPAGCVAVHVFIATIAVFGFSLFLSLSAMIYYWMEWKKIKDKLPAKSQVAENAQEWLKDGLSSQAVDTEENKVVKVNVFAIPENKVNGTEPSQVTVKSNVLSETKESVTKGTKNKEAEVERSCFINKADSSRQKTFNPVKNFISITAQQKVITASDQLEILHKISASIQESSRFSNSEKVKNIPTLQNQVKGTNFNLIPHTMASGTSVSSPDAVTNKTESPVLKTTKKVSFLIDNNQSVSGTTVGVNSTEVYKNTTEKVTDRKTTVQH